MEVTAFDVFVRNYDDGKPMITLTVQGTMTIEKLKKFFAEQCKFTNMTNMVYGQMLKHINYSFRSLLPREAAVLAWRDSIEEGLHDTQ